MRTRVKRRLFLMSMALATGASGHALAKDGKVGPEVSHYVLEDEHSPIHATPDEDRRDGGVKASALLSKVQNLLGGLSQGGEVPSRINDKGWRLQMQSAEARPDFGGDSRPEKTRHFGFALRVSF